MYVYRNSIRDKRALKNKEINYFIKRYFSQPNNFQKKTFLKMKRQNFKYSKQFPQT